MQCSGTWIRAVGFQSRDQGSWIEDLGPRTARHETPEIDVPMTNKNNSLVTTIFSFESPAQFPSTLEFDHSALHENRQPQITLSRISNGSLRISCKTLIRDYQKSSDKFRQQQWMESMEYAISIEKSPGPRTSLPSDIDLPPRHRQRLSRRRASTDG